MIQNDRETMQRAVGILEGAYYSATGKIREAIAAAIEMFEAILNEEEKT